MYVFLFSGISAGRGKYNFFTYYRPQRSWGKVMFLHVSVILFGGVSRPTPRGEVEGSGWGGSPGHTWWGSASLHAGIYSLPPTATAAGGMHPTGMNSYIK